MGTTINLLGDSAALLRTSRENNVSISINSTATEWDVLSLGTLEVISTDYVVDSRYVLKVYPGAASAIVIDCAPNQLTSLDAGRILSFNAKLRADSPVSVKAQLYIIDDFDENGPSHTQTLTSGLYSSVHSNRLVVPDDGETHAVGIRLTISNHNLSNIYITLPHLIHDLAFYENPFVGRSRGYLPDFYFEIDSAQEQPTFPFFRLIDALFTAAGDTSLEYDRMYGISADQLETQDELSEFWTNSTLVSTRSVRDAYVPWLSQFTCGPLKQNIQLSNGDYYFDNPAIQRDFIEWQLRGSHYGRAAGTREAMIESAKQVLIKTKDGSQSTKSVSLTPRFNGDPFALKLQTLTNETIDADSGEESQLVLDAVSLAKPLGYSLVHTTVDEFYFTLDDPTLGVLDELRYG